MQVTNHNYSSTLLSCISVVYLRTYNDFELNPQVNNNGNLSPGRSFGQYFPVKLPIDVPLLAVYWADVDTRPSNGGYIWYRHTTASDALDRALVDVRRAYPAVADIDYVFIATWDHVGFFSLQTNRV